MATQTGFAPDRGPVEVVDGISYHRLDGPHPHSLPLDAWLAQHVARVAELVRTLRPAVLHAASDYLNALTAGTVGAAHGIPVVYESRGFWEETYLSRQQQRYGWDLDTHAATYGLPDFYLRRREIEDRVRRGADRVVTLAGVMADRIVAGGVPRERIAVVPNAVDIASFPVPERDAGNLLVAAISGAHSALVGNLNPPAGWQLAGVAVEPVWRVQAESKNANAANLEC